MIKKKFRICKRKEFEEIKKRGRLIQTPLFGLLRLKVEDEETKFGWIISRKVSKKAVERNKIKRRMAEVLNKSKERWIDRSWRIIFLVKQTMVNKNINDIERVMESLWPKLGE